MSPSFQAEFEKHYGVQKNKPEIAKAFFEDLRVHIEESTRGQLFDPVFQRRMRDKSLLFSSQNSL